MPTGYVYYHGAGSMLVASSPYAGRKCTGNSNGGGERQEKKVVARGSASCPTRIYPCSQQQSILVARYQRQRKIAPLCSYKATWANGTCTN